MFGVLLVTLLAAGVTGMKSAEATTTFTVTETGDDADINLANDRCDSSTDTGDQCTLRAAIEEANDAVLNVVLGGLSAGAGADGLEVEAPDCTIRGLVIRNFDGFGIEITGSGAAGNSIEGNFIGVNRDGITAKGNLFGVYSTGDTNTVGGAKPGSRNVISGNVGIGIFIDSAGTGNRIEGNYVGTTADGTADLGNYVDGVVIAGDSNTVGGTGSGAGNVVSGNANGVFVSGPTATENRVEGNYVGTTADGTGDLGNAVNGVIITGGADLTAVGGTLPGAPNHIAHNGGDGVHISGSDSEGNNILSNSIFDNAELGIDLAAGVQDTDGVTANDTDGPSSAPNNLQNFPNITMVRRSLSTGQTIISGRLNSNPSQDFVVQCFLTDGTPTSDHGEGSRLLDTAPISTSADGRASFSCETSRSLLGQPGQTVSATATNVVTGDTSEFSKNKAISAFP